MAVQESTRSQLVADRIKIAQQEEELRSQLVHRRFIVMRDQQPELLNKLQKDPERFADWCNYELAKISDGEAGWRHYARHWTTIIPFGGSKRVAMHPYASQLRLIDELPNHELLTILKTRRLGGSKLVGKYLGWKASFDSRSPQATLINQSKKETNAEQFLAEIKTDLNYLPDWMRPGMGAPLAENTTLLQFHRGSEIQSYGATEERGPTAAVLVLDEAAHMRDSVDPEAVFAASIPTAKGGQVILISTGRGRMGRGGPFAQYYDNSTPLDPPPAGQGEGAGIVGFSLFFNALSFPGATIESVMAERSKISDPNKAMWEYPLSVEEALSNQSDGLALSFQHVTAAERRGREVAAEIRGREKDALAREGFVVGLDWGNSKGMVVIIPLSQGRIHIAYSTENSDPGMDAELFLLSEVSKFQQRWPGIKIERWDPDAAGSDENKVLKRLIREGRLEPVCREYETRVKKCVFNQRKRKNLNFIRTFLRRCSEGEKTHIITIDPENNQRLLAEMKVKEQREGTVVKGDDHVFDALIAGVTRFAKEWERMERDRRGADLLGDEDDVW